MTTRAPGAGMGAGGAPQPEEIRELCRRARAAGLPKAAARPRLVNEYLRLATALGVPPEDVRTGQDLVRASAALLRAPARTTRAVGGPAPSAV